MVVLQKIREQIIANRFREYRYQYPIPEYPSRILDQLERVRNTVPGLNYFDEFEKDFEQDLVVADFKVTIGSDECNDYIEIEAGVFGLYAVNYRYFRRKFECRITPKPTFTIPDPYAEPPDILEEVPGQARRVYVINNSYDEYYEDNFRHHKEVSANYLQTIRTAQLLEVDFPVEEFQQVGDETKQVYARVTSKTTFDSVANLEFYQDFEFSDTELIKNEDKLETVYLYYGDRFASYYGGFISFNYGEYLRYSNIEGFSFVRVAEGFFSNIDNGTDVAILVGSDDEPIENSTDTPLRTITSTFVEEYPDSFGNRVFLYRANVNSGLRITTRITEHLVFVEGEDLALPSPPPRDRQRRKSPPSPKPPMKCCPDYSSILKQIYIKVKENNEIVKNNNIIVKDNNKVVKDNNKLVLENKKIVEDNNKIVKENKKAIGFDEYPVSVPKSLINVNGKESGNEKKENLTQLLAWYIERFDEIVGQFEIPIEIEDTDLLKEGNQTVKFTLPNIAEAIAEIFLMVMNVNITNEVQLNAIMRCLAETGSDKQQNFKNNQMLEAIVEFLGFKYKDNVENLPLTFTPGGETLIEILTEKTMQVSTIEYNDDANLQKHLFELLQSAAIIRAKNWKQVDLKQDPKAQILATLLQTKDLVGQLTNGLDIQKLEKDINKINDEQNK